MTLIVQHRVRPLAWLVAAALSLLSLPLLAQPAPVVNGPESVADWFKAGEEAIQRRKAAPVDNRPARNVILFVGDGMGISTITAARILEGQLRASRVKRTCWRSTAFPTPRCPRPIRGTSRPPTRHRP